jgi:hypothetical protein
MFVLNKTLVFVGLVIWLGATAALRIAGQYVLRSNSWAGILILFALSFPFMAWLARRLCRRLPAQRWPMGAISLALPTLVLDPFSSAFFPAVFPNIAPEMAGVFGGWMLCCCAGALLGASIRPGTHS